MRRILALAVVLLAVPVAADLPKGVYRTARPVVTPDTFTAGMVYVPLDEAALDVESLGEYRIVRDGGVEVPYRMVVEDGSVLEEQLPTTVVDWAEAGTPDSVRILLDLGPEIPRADIVRLALRGDDFSAVATVAESRDTKEPPSPLKTDKVYRRGAGFEKMSVAFGPATKRYIYLTLNREEGKLPKVDSVLVFSTVTIPRRTAPIAAAVRFREDRRKRTTVVELDPGQRVRDLAEAQFNVVESVFDRPVMVEVAYAEPAEGERIEYTWSEGARLARRRPSEGAVITESIPMLRYLRMSVENGDDRPLTIRGVALSRTRRGLAFSAESGKHYELWYGREQAPHPSYDLSRLPLTPPRALVVGKLGAARALALAPPPPPPWSERHRALFWAVLVGVAVVLLVVIIRAMRTAESSAREEIR